MSPRLFWNDVYAISSPVGDHDGESSPVTLLSSTAAGADDTPGKSVAAPIAISRTRWIATSSMRHTLRRDARSRHQRDGDGVRDRRTRPARGSGARSHARLV